VGDIETRLWWGYLSESDYFDNNSGNDHNLITGLTIAYGIPFLPGLSIGFNRIMLSKWEDMNYGALFTLLDPIMHYAAGQDENDQRASVAIDYVLPEAGLDIYLEWGKNDYSAGGRFWRYPFHTDGFTFGTKKTLLLSNILNGEIILEITKLDCSQDYDRLINWSSTFYAHHIITQGHTNGGQWLGAGIGTGGNSQYLGFKLYFPKGYGQLFFQRRNPDLDYTWFIDSKTYPKEGATAGIAEMNIRAFYDLGISGLYYVTKNVAISGSFIFRDELNPLNKSDMSAENDTFYRYNIYASIVIKYSL
jgi:hypothetical protein